MRQQRINWLAAFAVGMAHTDLRGCRFATEALALPDIDPQLVAAAHDAVVGLRTIDGETREAAMVLLDGLLEHVTPGTDQNVAGRHDASARHRRTLARKQLLDWLGDLTVRQLEFQVAGAVWELRADPTPLPADAAAKLGLEPGASFAEGCRLLWWASADPTGPQCRSLRAAAYFLAGLDGDLRRRQLTRSLLPSSTRRTRTADLSHRTTADPVPINDLVEAKEPA